MNFEEVQSKLQQIKEKLGKVTEQKLLLEFNEIYKEAKGEETLAESLKDVMEELKSSSKDSEEKGLKGVLTPEQIAELEQKSDILTNALEEAKELRENSEKDKIDDYVANKIKNNEKESEKYEDENTVLQGQKRRLEGVYHDYQSNREAEKIAERISRLMTDIIEDLNIVNNKMATPKEKENANKELSKNGKEATSLLKENVVKSELVQYGSYFLADPSRWEVAQVTNIKNGADTLALDYKKKKEDSIKEFDNRIEEVPVQYEYTPVETYLKDINKKYSKIEDKWTAIGGRINENTKKIKEIEGQNKAYKQYAKDVKEKAEIEEKQQFSDDQLEDYLRREENLDQIVNQDGEVTRLARESGNVEQALTMLQARKPEDMDIQDVLDWKRKQYLIDNKGKANKLLDRINKKLVKEGETEKATIDDLMNNTKKVQDIRYWGKFRNNHRYGIRAKVLDSKIANIPVISKLTKFGKRHFCKEYYNNAVEYYQGSKEQIDDAYRNTRTQVKNYEMEAFKERLNVKNQAQTQTQQQFVNNMYQRTVNESEKEMER